MLAERHTQRPIGRSAGAFAGGAAGTTVVFRKKTLACSAPRPATAALVPEQLHVELHVEKLHWKLRYELTAAHPSRMPGQRRAWTQALDGWSVHGSISRSSVSVDLDIDLVGNRSCQVYWLRNRIL